MARSVKSVKLSHITDDAAFAAAVASAIEDEHRQLAGTGTVDFEMGESLFDRQAKWMHENPHIGTYWTTRSGFRLPALIRHFSLADSTVGSHRMATFPSSCGQTPTGFLRSLPLPRKTLLRIE